MWTNGGRSMNDMLIIESLNGLAKWIEIEDGRYIIDPKYLNEWRFKNEQSTTKGI
jgi:hypothetical protein